MTIADLAERQYLACVARGTGFLAVVGVVLAGVTIASAGTGAVSPAKVRAALIGAGYDARTQCGVVLVPPPGVGGGRHFFSVETVPTCWIVVEQDGYSVHVTPYATPGLAKLAYVRSRNRFARTTREAAIGDVLVSAYRLPSAEWSRISTVVEAALAAHA